MIKGVRGEKYVGEVRVCVFVCVCVCVCDVVVVYRD
jgi:hypothetical protein